MSQTMPDIQVGSSSWVDLNTARGVAVGTSISITNKGVHWVRLFEGDLAPDINSTDGEVLTSLPDNTAYCTIKAGSLRIWALCADKGLSSKITIQEV